MVKTRSLMHNKLVCRSSHDPHHEAVITISSGSAAHASWRHTKSYHYGPHCAILPSIEATIFISYAMDNTKSQRQVQMRRLPERKPRTAIDSGQGDFYRQLSDHFNQFQGPHKAFADSTMLKDDIRWKLWKR